MSLDFVSLTDARRIGGRGSMLDYTVTIFLQSYVFDESQSQARPESMEEETHSTY